MGQEDAAGIHLLPSSRNWGIIPSPTTYLPQWDSQSGHVQEKKIPSNLSHTCGSLLPQPPVVTQCKEVTWSGSSTPERSQTLGF